MKDIWRKGLTLCVILLTAASGLVYYPLRKIPVLPKVSEIGNIDLFGTGGITETETVVQQITAPWDYLTGISIYLQYLSEPRTGDLCLTLSDGEGNILFDAAYPMADIPNYEWWDIEIGKPLNRGGIYTFEISARGYGDKPPQLFAAAKEDAVPESGEYRYHNETADAALGLNYSYRYYPESASQAAPFWCLHILLAGIAVEIIWNFGKRGRRNERS